MRYITTLHDSNDSKFKTISKQRSRLIPTLTPKQTGTTPRDKREKNTLIEDVW